jgi:hypothetical protein
LARGLADCGRARDAVAEWEHLLEAIPRGETVRPGAQRCCAVACRELAALLWRCGDRERARRLHQHAIRTELGYRGSLSAATLLNAVELGGMETCPDGNTRLLRRIARTGSRRIMADARLRLARSAADRGDLPEALRLLRQAVRLAVGPRSRGEALAWHGCLLARTGRLAGGARMLRRGARCLLQIEDHPGARRLLKLARLVEALRARQQSRAAMN